MIPVNFISIDTFKLPLDNYSMVIKKSTETRAAKRKVYEFRKKYHCWNPNYVCSSIVLGNVAYNYIAYEERKALLSNYELVVRSSMRYRFLILISIFGHL